MKKYDKELTTAEVLALTEKYYHADGYKPLTTFEHRCDMEWGEQMIYSFVRDFQPTSCLEFGASFGGSVAAAMAALQKNNKPFVYVASEQDPNILNEARQNVMRSVGAVPTFIGKIEDNLASVPKKLDYLFIDTNHDLENCLWYIEHIFPRMKEGALFHLHDWCIYEENGELKNARDEGVGPEIWHLFDLLKKQKLPFRKLYWAWGDGIRTSRGGEEECASSFWIYDSSMVKKDGE